MNEIEKSLKAVFENAEVVIGTKEKPIITNNEILPIKHYFMDGVYVREMVMNAGMLVVGAIHKHLHMCFLLQGRLSVASDSGITDYVAPCTIIAGPGERRVLYAHEYSVWYNTHKNPSNTEDVDQLEKDIVAISYEEYEQHVKNK